MMKSLGIACLVLVLGTACGSSRAAAHSRPALRKAEFPAFRLSFNYPAVWRRTDCTPDESLGAGIITLLESPGVPRCKATPKALRGRIFVSWAWNRSSNGVGSYFARSHFHVDGRAARKFRGPSTGGWCSGPEGARVVTVDIKGGPETVYAMAACIFGPHFGPGETALRKMLRSVRFARG